MIDVSRPRKERERRREPQATAAEALWDIPQLSAFLGVPVATIYGWRTRGKGPVGFHVGKHIRFRREDVEAWLASRRDGGLGTT